MAPLVTRVPGPMSTVATSAAGTRTVRSRLTSTTALSSRSMWHFST
jgi:hypothetical protein